MLINKKKTAKKQQIMIKNYFKSTPSWTIFLQGWQKVKFLYFETFVTIVPYGQDRCVNCHRELAIEYLMNIDGIVLSTRDPEHGLYRSRGRRFVRLRISAVDRAVHGRKTSSSPFNPSSSDPCKPSH